MFCPNVNSEEFKKLVEAVGSTNIAHYLWDKYKGEVPSYFYKRSMVAQIKGAQSKKFVTSEAKVKQDLRNRGLLTNTLDIPSGKLTEFRQEVSLVTAQYKEKYGLEGRLLTDNGKKATVNKEMFYQIDAINGIFYPENEKYRSKKGPDKAYSAKATPRTTSTINTQKAAAWLTERFGENAVNFYDHMENIGDEEVHGYVEDASIYLWTAAGFGTEYHEAYHLVFRTMLSEAQREGLYSEAAEKFGEPTAEEIAKIKSQFKNISDETARLVALEEKMAEEFREYVLTEEESGKTLPGQIKSWFKNLWNWIKAIFSDSLSLKQTYSLIESNNFNKSFAKRNVFRNPQKFTNNNKAYYSMPGMHPNLVKEIVETIDTIFMDAKHERGADFKPSLALGSGDNKGSIANYFAKIQYVKLTADGNYGPLKSEEALETFNIEENILQLDKQLKNELAKGEGADQTIVSDLESKIVEGKQKFREHLVKNNFRLNYNDTPENKTLRNTFRAIYNMWNTVYDPITGNIERLGFRDMLEIKLKERGFSIKTKDSNDYELQQENLSDEEKEAIENELEVLDGHVEKIYGKSSLEDSPSKRLTGKLKELLATITKSSPNSLGFKTYYDREELYKELLGILSDRPTFRDMMRAFENTLPYKPHLRPVYDFFKGLKEQEKAMIFSAFALTTTEFIIMRRRQSGKNVLVDVFNPNRKAVTVNLVDHWKTKLVGNDNSDPNAVYYTQEITEEGKEGITVYTLTSKKKKEIKEAVDKLHELLFSKDIRNLGKYKAPEDGKMLPIAEAVGKLAYALKITPGRESTLKDTQFAIQSLMNNGVTLVGQTGEYTVSGYNLAKTLADKLMFFVEATKAFTIQKNAIVEEVNKSASMTFIDNYKKQAYEIAEIFEPLVNIAGESFTNGEGKQIYPTNLSTHMSEIIRDLKDGGRTQASAEFYKMLENDPFIGAHGNIQYESILLRMLKTPGGKEIFEVSNFDSSKDESAFTDITLYEGMSPKSFMIAKLNAFINSGAIDRRAARIAVSIQSDRSRLDFLQTLNPILTGANNVNGLIKAQIVQDLLRVSEAKRVIRSNDPTLLIEDYHTGPRRALDPKFFQWTAVDENGNQIVTDQELGVDKLSTDSLKRMSDVIDDFVNGKLNAEEKKDIEARLNEMAKKIKSYLDAQAVKVEELIKDSLDEVGFNVPLDKRGRISEKDMDKVRSTIKGFVYLDSIMRNEFVKIFRGNRAFTKNIVNFYKRMGHLTTPGSKLATMSDLNSDTYGMLDEFNEITLYDLKKDLQIVGADGLTQKQRSAEVYKNLKAGLLKVTSEEEAEKISSAYDSGQFESTDAQAFISLEMHRHLLMGEGKWDMETDEPAYKAYKKTGRFEYQEGHVPKGFKAGDAVPILPHKKYYEASAAIGNTAATISQKNSYNVLIKDYTKDYPQLNELRKRMEGEGVYAGLQKVHVVNFVSGSKIARQGVHTVTGVEGEYAGTLVKTYDSKGLRTPQTIPDAKDSPTVAINRQIKKNMLANVIDDANYYYNSGLESEFEISGKDLKDIAHAAIEEKLRRDFDSVIKEFKVKELQAAEISGDKNAIKKARLEFLKVIRSKIQSEAASKDISTNFLQALHIVFDEQGMPRFNVPLDFPIYSSSFESVLLSAFTNEVFKQKMSGFEAVQVAQIGGHATSDDLKFYEIKSEKGKQRLVHAEIMIREDVARRFGVEPGTDITEVPEELLRVIGYRIPNQDQASTVMLKIVRFLPANYAKAVVVPGEFTKLMGSDFDVDKLNLLFPELEKDENSKFGVKKVNPDYNVLKQAIKNKNLAEVIKDKKLFTKKGLVNIIWDTFEAVGTNENHLVAALSPLDGETLKKLAADIEKANPALKASEDWNSIMLEGEIMIRNQAGNQLRGIYANILAARNVFVHGQIAVVQRYAPTIVGEQSYNTLQNKTKEGQPTDKSISLYLSSAVDAANEALQYALNDNIITANVRALFLNFVPDYDSQTVSYFLNQPIIRKFVEIMQSRYGNDRRRIGEAFNSAMAWADTQAKESKIPSKSDKQVNLSRGFAENAALILNGKNSQIPMLREEINNLSSENRDWTEQKIMLHNFRVFYTAGRSLIKLGKRVTPDTMDGFNRIGGTLSYRERALEFETTKRISKELNYLGESEENEEDLEENINSIFYNPSNRKQNVADQFIGEDSVYGMERGYDKLINDTLGFAKQFLFKARLSDGVQKAKAIIKDLSGQTELTPELHNFIDEGLQFLLLAEPESPLYDAFTEENVKLLYKRGAAEGSSTIGQDLEWFKENHPLIKYNKFIQLLSSTYDPTTGLDTVSFDNAGKFTLYEKEQIITGFKALLFSPSIYLSRPAEDKILGADGKFINPEVQAEVGRLKIFARKLVYNAFISNAFRKSSSSYTQFIPTEAFTYPLVAGKPSIAEYISKKTVELQNPDYFDADQIGQFMAMFGLGKAGGRPLLSRHKISEVKIQKVKGANYTFIAGRQPGVKKLTLMIRNRGMYVPLSSNYMSGLYYLPALTANNEIQSLIESNVSTVIKDENLNYYSPDTILPGCS